MSTCVRRSVGPRAPTSPERQRALSVWAAAFGALGDLTQFSLVKEHYATRYEHERDLFTPGTRPARVRELYESAAATPPLHVIRCLGHDESSELDSRGLFLCMPVWGDAAKRRLALDLDIETRRPASLLVGKEAQDGTSDGEEPLLRLPSPEEKMHALSLEYPPVVVPIDTSESNFNRLSSVRRSLIHVDFLIKRKKHHKRRNTISDGNSKEIEEALASRKKSGTIVKTEALIHTSCQTDDDLLTATTSSAGKSSRSKRRSEGSPSSGDLSSSSAENNAAAKTEKRSSFYEAMNFKLGRDWKFLKKSSKKEEGSSKNESVRAGDGKAESGTSTGGTDKKRRSFLPISTNSAAMTVAVKLRETSARTGSKGMEDGQSSSGNWSASSSTRASVDSDQQTSMASPDTMPHSHSESSLGKDSLFSDNTHHSTDGRSHDETVAGYSSDASIALTGTTAASSWKPGPPGATACRSNINSSSTDPESQSGTITPETCQSDSKSSSSPRRKISVGSDPFTSHIDDGDSSVYSVDTDGYYTSMHTDSGLIKHTPGKFGEEAEEGNFAAAGDRGSQTSIDTIGNLSLNSFLSQNANDTGNDTCSIASTLTQRSRVPPAPPPRLCSVRTLSPIPSQKENSPPLSAGDVSESDCEVGERLRRKTSIGSFRYPSICAVSPEPSDEENCRLDLEKRAPKKNPPASGSNGAAQLTTCKGSGQEAPRQKRPETEIVEENEDSSEADRCNMYGVQSPRKVPFLNAIVSQTDVSPNAGKQPTLGSFSSAECELTFDTAPDSSRGGGTKRVTICEKPSKNPAAEATATSDAISQRPGVRTTPGASTSPVSDVQPRNSPGDVSRVSVGTTASPTKGSEQTEGMRQTQSPPKSGGSATASSPSYTPFYLNRPSSLMSRTRSPFLSYLSRNASPTKTSSTPSPPSPARSPGLMGSCWEAAQLTPRTTDAQECPKQSSPTATTPHTSPRGSPQTSPQTTPPAVPPPPPPLTYSSKVLERGSARLPSVTNEPNSVFTQSSTSSRVGARVTLDPEGKVIYSSNSLGRRRDGQPVNFGSRKIPCPSVPSANKYATLPPMVSPALNADPRAYVKLDPGGAVETYSSSTIPRTRHSVSAVGASPSRGEATSPTGLPRATTPSSPSGMVKAHVPAAGLRTPQLRQESSGRSTPQPTSTFLHASGSLGRVPPVQRPASISTPYESRPAGTSTPVSLHSQASSGRVTPVHHFSPISLPTSTAPGRRTPLQPSPREPIGSTWVSGLPPPPFGYPVTSSPQHASPPNFIQHPAQTRVPQQFNGRTTPVQRYTPPSDPYIPCPGSPARGYPSMPPYFAPSVASWDSGRTTPTQKNPVPTGPCDTGAPYGTPDERRPVQAYGQEGPRAVPVNSQGYGGRQPLELVNGRTTPAEYSYQTSVPQQRGQSPNPAYSSRTTLDTREGARVSMLRHQNYGNPNHANETSPVHDGIRDNRMRVAQPMTNGPKQFIPEQHRVYYGVHGQNDRQNPPQPQRHALSPTRQALPATNTDTSRLVGPPHIGGQNVWPVRASAPTPAYGSNQRSSERNYGSPEQRAFVLSGSKTMTANDSSAYADSLRNAYNSQNTYLSPPSAQCTNEQSYAALRGLPKRGSPTGLSSTSLSSSGSERSPDNSSSSTSITRELRRKPMSAEDLFAVIHSSKKKHGIKTEADLAQSPLSSRSSSPMVSSRPSTPSRGGLAETGFLSPRSSRDRRSWSGDVSLIRTPGSMERRSLANDRLGPVKPTSLLDFKKLLLQTKTTGQNGRAKKSAVELLKAGPAGKGSEEAAHSLPTSPVNVPSPAESPTGASWTSTVPLKRGGRVRSSLQHRYDHMYPPILEDCSEDDGRAASAKQKTGELREVAGGVPHSPPSSTWV